MNKGVLIGLLFACACIVQAQSRISLGVTPGLMYYTGDLKGNPWPESGYNHFSIGADLGYRFGPILNLTFGYAYGKVSGADSLVPGNEVRNLHFESVMNDVRLMASIDLWAIKNAIWQSTLLQKQDWKAGFTGPDLIIGVGMLKFKPKGFYEGEWHELQPLGTEGQNLGGDNPEPYSLWQFNVKFGFGLGYRISRSFKVSATAVYSLLFTDYLDDVSGSYPDYNKLTANPEGEKTEYFTYGGRDGSTISEGSSRGNPDRNDGFMIIGIKCTYVFSKAELQRLMNIRGD